jgi:hypothetical protein
VLSCQGSNAFEGPNHQRCQAPLARVPIAGQENKRGDEFLPTAGKSEALPLFGANVLSPAQAYPGGGWHLWAPIGDMARPHDHQQFACDRPHALCPCPPESPNAQTVLSNVGGHRQPSKPLPTLLLGNTPSLARLPRAMYAGTWGNAFALTLKSEHQGARGATPLRAG